MHHGVFVVTRVSLQMMMPEEWRDSILIQIVKNKGDVQSCSNYRGIHMISHTMKRCGIA